MPASSRIGNLKSGLRIKAISLFVFALAAACPSLAQRKPVLPQIDLPHPYYYREMYLPQLTSGPSSMAWLPDSREVVYSMAGSLWRQKLDSKTAQQLTDGAGYDYQPDCSPDGKNVIYVSYQKDAMELWLLNLATGKTQQLTSGGAVNVEPRWSPDGKRIVFVSTSYNKRFHIFRADVQDVKLENIVRLTGETKSDLPRYYYSAYDMEISPVWTRDGKEILFVSNRGHIHGTGGFWRMKAEPGAEAREIHYEETNWKARPDFSPDGSRMVYSSYLGRQWHQLWVMPANGGDAFPISYGEWDDTNVRWSPDGTELAFISNARGNTELWLQNTLTAEQKAIVAEEKKYLRPHTMINITVSDDDGEELSRISVMDSRGKFCAPSEALIRADEGYDRAERPFEAHYFYLLQPNRVVFEVPKRGEPARTAPQHATGVEVPEGMVTIDVMRGFEDAAFHRAFDTRKEPSSKVIVKLKPLAGWHAPTDGEWVSADLHVHMNYGGTYLMDSSRLRDQGEAEGLGIINNLIVNKEQRFPDIDYAGKGVEGDNDTFVVTGQEFHTSYWGHRGLLNLKDHILLPGYAGYPNTAAASLYPMNADVYDMAHQQGAVVGAVHPFDAEPNPLANPPERITDELPVDAALGKLDYMEIVGFSDHKSTAAVWYRLLNLGFRIPAGAGTDAMMNYASLRGPLGMNRVYAWVPTWPANIELWLEALQKGRTLATNGPLMEFKLDGQRVGEELQYKEPRESVPFTAKLRSIVPVDHFEIVCNGRVEKVLALGGARDSADVSGTLPLKESGWCVLRAYSDKAEYPVLDNYVYATTSPIYVTIGGKAPQSPEDARYFVAWIERVADATSHYPDWNSPAEKASVLKKLEEAKAVFEKLR